MTQRLKRLFSLRPSGDTFTIERGSFTIGKGLAVRSGEDFAFAPVSREVA
jgi:hypothetical protein